MPSLKPDELAVWNLTKIMVGDCWNMSNCFWSLVSALFADRSADGFQDYSIMVK